MKSKRWNQRERKERSCTGRLLPCAIYIFRSRLELLEIVARNTRALEVQILFLAVHLFIYCPTCQSRYVVCSYFGPSEPHEVAFTFTQTSLAQPHISTFLLGLRMNNIHLSCKSTYILAELGVKYISTATNRSPDPHQSCKAVLN